MKQKIVKMYGMYYETHNLQKQILKEMISGATNETIVEFLNELLDNQIDTPRFTHLLGEIHKLELYMLNIGSEVPDDFPKEISYYFRIKHNKLACCKLTFTINNNTIENIKYKVK